MTCLSKPAKWCLWTVLQMSQTHSHTSHRNGSYRYVTGTQNLVYISGDANTTPSACIHMHQGSALHLSRTNYWAIVKFVIPLQPQWLGHVGWQTLHTLLIQRSASSSDRCPLKAEASSSGMGKWQLRPEHWQMRTTIARTACDSRNSSCPSHCATTACTVSKQSTELNQAVST